MNWAQVLEARLWLMEQDIKILKQRVTELHDLIEALLSRPS